MEEKPHLLHHFGSVPRTWIRRALRWREPFHHSLRVSHHPSCTLKSAREEMSPPALLFSTILGLGTDTRIQVCLIQVGGGWSLLHLFRSSASDSLGICLPARKAAFQGHPRGLWVEVVDWCQAGVWVQCLATRPPVSPALPTPSCRGGRVQVSTALWEMGDGGLQALFCLSCCHHLCIQVLSGRDCAFETCVLFPGSGRWSRTPLLLEYKASEAPGQHSPTCLSVCLSEVGTGEQQDEGVSRLRRAVDGVLLNFII